MEKKKYVFTSEDMADLRKTYERARDETRQYPNSFGHGYNVGRLEALLDFQEFEVPSK